MLTRCLTVLLLLSTTNAFAAVEKKLSSADQKDRKAIRKVVLSKRSQIRACYLSAAKVNPEIEGKVFVKWEILPYGKVGRVKVEKSTVQNASLERCLASRIKRWRFPVRGDIGTRKVTYPFQFLQKVATKDLDEAAKEEQTAVK